jgi:GntR family transcriptional repressor for pyruvate dehydrogenase complex
MAVAFASKNPVLIHLMRNFYDFLFIGIKKNLTHMYQETSTLHDVIDHHREVYNSIRDHEPDRADVAMRTHIKYVQKYFRLR